MNKKFAIRQGNSYIFIGELKDCDGNSLELSKYERITILVTSPSIHRVVIREPNYQIKDNKIVFKLSTVDTRFFKNFVKIEAELRIGETVIVGMSDDKIQVIHNNISKLTE